MFAYGDVSAHGRGERPGQLPEILREVADRIEATSPDRKIGGSLGTGGGTVGAFALVDDDEVWQQNMRAQLDT
jgi:hypothetical protein